MPPGNIGKLSVDLELSTAAFQANIQKATATLNSNVAQMKRSMDVIQGTAGLVQGAIAAWAGSAVIGAIKQTINAYSDAEQSVVQLNSALASTGRASEAAITAIQDAASAISKVTTFDDDDLVAADATLAQFAKRLTGPELAAGEKAIAGLATVMKVDLNTAAMQIGKTVSGATDTIGRSGIKISGASSQAERLNQVLEKTASFFSSAQGAAESTSGRLAQLNVSWGNLQETIGETILKSIDSSNAFKVVNQAVQNLDAWLKQNQSTIQGTIRFFLMMGETAVQMAGVAFNAVAALASSMVSQITGTVSTGMKAIQALINGTVSGINQTIGLVNSLSGIKLKPVSGFSLPGLGAVDALDSLALKSTMNFSKNAVKGIRDIFSGKSVFKFQIPSLSKLGSLPSLDPDSGTGKGKKAKGAHKQQLTEAQKDYQKQKQLADQLKESLKSVWDKEADSIAEANKLLKLHLITQEQYNQAVLNYQRTAHDSFKIEGVHDAVNTFMKPHKDFLDKFDASLDDALGDSQFQAVQQVIQETLTPLEKYNQQVAYLTELHDNAGLSTEVFGRAMKAAKLDMDEGLKSTQKFSQAVSNVISQFGDQLFQTVTSSLQGSKNAFKDFVASAMADLAKLIFKMTVTIPIANALSNALTGISKNAASSGKGGGGGGFLSSIGSLFSGFLGGGGAASAASGGGSLTTFTDLFSLLTFADGGSPPVNQVSLVGERGPELFVPKTAGTIIPNQSLSSLGGSSSQQVINVNQTINVSTGVQETVQAELAAMRPQLRRDAVDAVSQGLRKGGQLARQVGIRH
jgi:hypothetical protein